jgi:Na+/H+ antiporter NhaC
MRWIAIAGLLLVPALTFGQTTLAVQQEGMAIPGGALKLKVEAEGIEAPLPARVLSGGRELQAFELVPGEQIVELSGPFTAGRHELVVESGPLSAPASVRVIPGWLSVTPPLLAIALALIFKDVIISLFLGVFLGALIIYDWRPLSAFARSVDSIIAPALADPDHAKIIVFSLLLGGMIGLISRSGGTLGIVERVRGFATNVRRGQLTTWLMGVFIFFDDYANTLIVGSTMRPITDRLRISREKLAYIVDSTAAPIASLVPISTWIGFEVGLIAAAFTQLQLPFNAYTVFIETIPYRFYPILALVLGFTIAFTRRDFGAMARAEQRAASTGEVIAPGDVPLSGSGGAAMTASPEGPHRAMNAVLPILTVIGVTIIGMFVSGSQNVPREGYASTGAWLRDVFGEASSLDVLLWASLSAVAVALVLPLVQRILTMRQAMEAMIEGFRSMMLAMVVLVLAWSIGSIAGQLQTAEYVVALTSGVLSPHFLPVIVFMTAAAVAFATGTSWGTMGILMPLVIPVAHGLAVGAGNAVGGDLYMILMLGTISSVLAGSVWGDHCSPISDTTILSSMGAGCDHIAHVKTQLPYALAVGVLAMLIGDIPTAYGLHPIVSLIAGAVIIVLVVHFFGKRTDETMVQA